MKRHTFGLMILILCLGSCIPVIDHVSAFQVINHSDKGQIIYYSCSDSIGSAMDSLTMNPYFKQFDQSKVAIKGEDVYVEREDSTLVRISGKKESLVRRCKDGYLRFFFIHDSVFLNNPWDTIVKYQMYNKVLVFSKKDLERINWIIEYDNVSD